MRTLRSAALCVALAFFLTATFGKTAPVFGNEKGDRPNPGLDADRIELPAGAVIVPVQSAHELASALERAEPGHVILLADGEYDHGGPFRIQEKRGTVDRPIIVRAQNQGDAVISGDSWFFVDDSTYVVIEGLKFTTTDATPNSAVRLRNTSYSRVTRNHFALIESFALPEVSRHWVRVDGSTSEYNRIDHNFFEKKRRTGNFVTIDGDDVRPAQHTRIDHNHFFDVAFFGSGGMEAIRIGTSGVSRADAHTIIEYNLFEACNGEIEIISIKSGGNHVRYNTFLESEGTVTLRHGNGNSIYGNFFIGNDRPGTGGVRVYGADQKVYNNYFEGLGGTGRTAAVALGAADVEDQVTVMDYWQVERALVAFNTMVNNQSAISIAPEYSGHRPFTPVDTVIANNLITSDKRGAQVSLSGPADIEWIGNLMDAAGIGGPERSDDEVRRADPALLRGINGFFPGENSPARNAALGTFPEVVTDIEGKPRSERPDIGAFQNAGLPPLRGPLQSSDVGPAAGTLRPVSLDEPGVYIPMVDMVGERLASGAWWGPVALDVGVVATGLNGGEPQIRAEINGAEVYGGEGTGARFVLNRGDLEDGVHSLRITADVGTWSAERSFAFSVQNLRVVAPSAGGRVRGDAAIEFAVGMPPEAVERYRLVIGGQIVYDEPHPPATVDVRRVPDGPQRLEAEVVRRDGGVSSISFNVLVDNTWRIRDALQPPQVSWLGTLDRTMTSSRSAGWRYATDAPEDFHGDADRKVRTSQAEEWLVWESPNLVEAVVILYAPITELAGELFLDVSPDGERWERTPYVVDAQGSTPAGWHRLVLTAQPDDPHGVRYVRLTLAERSTVQERARADVQIGHVELTGWNE